jgi:HSP20 family molecular chaperone IbpA
MTMLPARRQKTDRENCHRRPSGELGAIHERMGQLVNAAFTDLGISQMKDMPPPPADLTETDDTYLVHVDLPVMRKDQLNMEVSETRCHPCLITSQSDPTKRTRHPLPAAAV